MADNNDLNIAIYDEEKRTVTYVDDEQGLITVKLRPNDGPKVTFELPTDVLEALRRVAEERHESVKSLIKWYISKGVREDNTRHFAALVLSNLHTVLEKHSLDPDSIDGFVELLRRTAGKGSDWQRWSDTPVKPSGSRVIQAFEDNERE